MSLRRQKHTRIPVWVRLKHLPMEYWMEEGLSAVASGIGVPLYTDKITRECSRLDFARVCVMLDYNSVIPKHVVVVSPILREGKETPSRIDIEYEWVAAKMQNLLLARPYFSNLSRKQKTRACPPSYSICEET
ncbi:UNVERIFIED_CONTAM: hypothetical protein Scaly_3138600 [Sesamum calycinum]|uniref:DUF4283 domain-containing protein n=1 Tax=Sesamum calycinum TaxID=2727403 RepID=A0AAW2JI28_9LAMI